MVDSLLVFADPSPTIVGDALRLGGLSWEAVDSVEAERRLRPAGGWSAAVLVAHPSITRVLEMAEALQAETPHTPRLVVVGPSEVRQLGRVEDTFDDFCVVPVGVDELCIRLGRLVQRAGPGDDDELIVCGPLAINTLTYQARLDGRPLDLTYMEYELLKYFAQHPGRVCTREVLLSQVWGYDYYGGARTVDVHVRRLRAKLGEPHAGLIGTVRSVGYRFGGSGWN